MADDLSDVYAELRKLQEQVRVLMSANPLEKSSVTNGQIRIIGGTIRVDGGGNLIVNGTMSVNGTSTVTGSFTVSGPWNLSGTGTISGNVTITGNVTATGTLTQNGPWNLNGAGTIAGNVTQTGNTTQQGNVNVTGGGKITVGSMVIDPSISGGAITFANGSQVFTDGSTIQVFKGNSVMQVSNDYARIQYGGSVVEISASGIRVTGIGTKTLASTPGAFAGAIVYDGGYMKRVV